MLKTPLMLLNAFAAVIGLVWLGFLGNGAILTAGIVVLVVLRLALPLAALPAQGFAGTAARLKETGKPMAARVPFVLAGLFYVLIMNAAVSLGVIWLLIFKQPYGSLLAALFWAYGTATFMWDFLSHKDQGLGPTLSFITAMANQLGTAAACVYIYLYPQGTTLAVLAYWYAIAAGIGLLVNITRIFGVMRDPIDPRRRMGW